MSERKNDRTTAGADALSGLRVPPTNLDAEQALLGAIMANNAAYDRVAAFLRPDHFADPPHAIIYAAIARTIERGHIADPITLKNSLSEDGTLAEVGGIAYLAKLVGATVSIISAGDYGRAIHDCFLRRELIALAVDLANDSYAASEEHQGPFAGVELVQAAEAKLFALGDRGQADRPVVQAGAAAADAVRLGREAAARGGVAAGVASGIAGVDRMVGGWPIGAMSVVGARPAMGKSAFLLTVAARAANAGTRVLFASLEMRPDQIGARLVAAAAGMAVADVRKGGRFHQDDAGHWRFTSHDHHDHTALEAVAARVARLPLVIDYRPGLSAAQLRARARREKRRGGLGLIVVDYLGLMTPSDAVRRHGNRVQQLGELSRDLVLLAGELGVPVLVAAQLSREVEKREDKRPQLADLRDSGEIEQDAETVSFLYRAEYYLERGEPQRQPKDSDEKYANACSAWARELAASRGRAELIAAKNRQDRTGPVRLRFLNDRTWFADEAEHDPIAPFGPDPLPSPA